MTYKEFKAWVNERCCDGMWGAVTAILCMKVAGWVSEFPRRKREAAWQEFNHSYKVVEDFINPTNAKIEEIIEKMKGK